MDVGQRVVGHLGERRFARRLRRLQEGDDQLRLVVEHLLEVRHPPPGVDRVAVEAAAHVVAHAAEGHGAQRLEDHVAGLDVPGPRVLAQQEEQLGRPREPGRGAEPAVAGVEDLGVLADPGRQQAVVGRAPRSRPGPLGFAQPFDDAGGRGRQLAPRLAPALGDLGQDLHEPGPPPPGGGREVGAAVERLEVGGQPDAHRPPPRAGRGLHERHVHAVDVGALLAVDLHGDEVLVQDAGDVLVLERLVLHDVAPVARRVADGQEDGPVLRAGAGERLVPPGVPVDRIVAVLEEVGARLVGEAVRHQGDSGSSQRGYDPSVLSDGANSARCIRARAHGRSSRVAERSA